MKRFSGFDIVHDKTDGELAVYLEQLHGKKNRTYHLMTNVDGRRAPTESAKTERVIAALNDLVDDPEPDENELVVGFTEGSTTLCFALASLRGSLYQSTTRLTSYDADAIQIDEPNSKIAPTHYLYNVGSEHELILVEDEISTGNTMLGTIEVLRERNIGIKAVVSLVEVMNFGARDMIQQETGIEFQSLVGIELTE